MGPNYVEFSMSYLGVWTLSFSSREPKKDVGRKQTDPAYDLEVPF